MKLTNLKKILILLVLFGAACSQKKADEVAASTTPPQTEDTTKPRYLYVTSGTCYSGTGNTTFTATTASNLVYRLSLATGKKDMTIADFNSAPANAGDSPVCAIEQDKDNLLVAVESTSGRRIEKVAKAASPSRAIFSSNTAALSAVLKSIIKTPDNGYLIAKTAGIEKFSSQGVRIGSAAYVGTSLGTICGATNTNIIGAVTNSSGKIFYINALASNNRWGVITSTGYNGLDAHCLGVRSAPNANSYPVAIVYLQSVNQVMVAYAGNAITTDLNSIYVYDFDDTTNAISTGVKIYDSSTYVTTGYLLYGISAMTYDSVDNSLYVATAISSATTVVNYSIEKLSYNPSAKTLTRVASDLPFYNYGVDTKCISSLAIAE
ncbi:MAG: hypothetical protein J0M15_10320 [Deltaproteobacteria bacterium]|jgi:hypothetical protein|nr:hypothetical protein [Deltaproteobacteria bacterium]